MRPYAVTRLETWMCAALLVCVVSGCPDTSAGTDASGDDMMSGDVANDLKDAGIDAMVDVLRPMDVANDVDGAADGSGGTDAAPLMDATDVAPMGCVPGMSIACACVDGRAGAQVCQSDRTYAACVCATPDAGTGDASVPDVVLPPLGARLIAPQSVSRVTSRRPTMRWVLPDGVNRARVEVCGDRACTRVLATQEVKGSSWRPSAMLPPGVAYWRVRGLNGDGGVAWSSATWEYVVGLRDAPVDTSFGTIKDFNGDGYDDVAVPGYDPDTPGGPYVIDIFNGRTGMGSSNPFARLVHGADQIIGIAAGDFNGDGYADLVVDTSPGVVTGSIWVRYGGSAGLSQLPSLHLNGDGRGGFAQRMAIGDVNGDGFSDLILVSILNLDASVVTKVLDVFSGSIRGLAASSSGPIATPDVYVRVGTATEYEFELAGDVNDDGYADVVTGYSRLRDDAGTEQGRAWVVTGHPVGPMRSWTVLGPPSGTPHFGGQVSGVGDLDGDGVADFAIRSDEEVSVYLGVEGAIVTRPVTTLRNPEAPCYLAAFGFGSRLGRPGDYDGDGRADLAIGARCLPYSSSFQFGVGSAFVYSGRAGGVAMSPQVFRGMLPRSQFGGAIGGVGDFNNDGYNDLAILQTESAEEFFGAPIEPPLLHVVPGSSVGLSLSVHWTFRGNVGNFLGSLAAFMAQSSFGDG